MGNIGTWQLVIVLAIVLLLFGAKRLPEAARGLGRSLKIFKTETQGLVGGDDEKSSDESGGQDTTTTAPTASSSSGQREVERTPSTQPQASEPVDEQSKREA